MLGNKFSFHYGLLIGLLWIGTTCLAFQPVISKNTFDKEYQSLVYFEDSSSVMIHEYPENYVHISKDDGATWKRINSVGNNAARVIKHPFNNLYAYIIGKDTTHWFTKDAGETWAEFKTEVKVRASEKRVIEFHSSNPNYMLLICGCKENEKNCAQKYYYTNDGFESNPSELTSAISCLFSHNNLDMIATKNETIICVSSPDNNIATSDRQVIISDDWFKSGDIVLGTDGVILDNILGIAVAGSFLIAAKIEDPKTGDIGLYVSKDAITWNLAEFPDGDDKLVENAFTLLESSFNSVHVDILPNSTKDLNMGLLYLSNSDGTRFTKSINYTNRASSGYVDIEKVVNIDGIIFVNTVSNAKDLITGRAVEKEIRTKISIDDGRTWRYISVEGTDCKGDESCGLNLHSVNEKKQSGRVFSTNAPGIILAVASPGNKLEKYDNSDLYISEDAGLTWRLSRKGPHVYEVGDQGNLIIAMPNNLPTSNMFYSLDRGRSWEIVDLKYKTSPVDLTTTPDSTSLKFLLLDRSPEEKVGTISINFEGVYNKVCNADIDFEKWYARYDGNGSPGCLMGHKQYFWRKKLDAKCVVGNLYNEPIAIEENCSCTDQDYECDFNFTFDPISKKCLMTGNVKGNINECSSSSPTFSFPSGYRLIPGNTCTKENSPSKEEPLKISCSEKDYGEKNKLVPEVATSIERYPNELNGRIIDYFYLEKSDTSSTEETIIMRTLDNEVFISHNQGKDWKRVIEDYEILSIVVNPYFPDQVYFVTTGNEVIFSADRVRSYVKFIVPVPINSMGINALSFHMTKPNWLIWTGEIGCNNPFSPECKSIAFYSTNQGKTWAELQSDILQCTWIGGLKFKTDDSLIYCQKKNDQGIYDLISSTNYFKKSEKLLEDVLGFANSHEFVFAARKDPDDRKSLKAFVSVDGKKFVQADFPVDVSVDHQQAYTLLDSSTHSIFLHITSNNRPGTEFGTILKSNSNGTSYVTSVDNVNRNEQGYVDFEKIQGLEGIAIINTVENPESSRKGSKKVLKTKITYNDGGEWSYLVPPQFDSEGKKYECSGDLKGCSLNIHGYTERADYRDTFSSQSAIGMMIGVGNVGESLTSIHDGNTFLTRDGGITWKEIRKGYYMWEYGDQGSILVIVNGKDNTNTLYYSLDEGDSWAEYKFSEELIKVEDLATVPSDSSRKFIIFGRPPLNKGEKSVIIQIDFSKLTERQCYLNPNDEDNDDFELWSPRHPFQEGNCLFGHEITYHRKIPGRDCYIGNLDLTPHATVSNCACTRQDYECDFNYFRADDGSCQLVNGLSPPDNSLICSEMPGTIEYWVPTGYRRVPLSTCEGGNELDKIESHPCPGKEKEYEDRNGGLHGFMFLVVVLLPIMMFALVIYLVWQHFNSQRYTIRLGDEELEEESLIIKYGVNVVAGVVAAVSIIPTLTKSVIQLIKSRIYGSYNNRFTTRGSFSRNSYGYSDLDVEDRLHSEQGVGLLDDEEEDNFDIDEEDDSGNDAIDNVIVGNEDRNSQSDSE
ncbi:vacuolar protein sorting/targeting protein 10 [Nadsonia fulvescens var. elongata DSM 6958]|uniref:Vacuolar protein sorting/targeting protein 10 n=1 Tax=Nadsonia fulvescens var. elongata DSM 6958 TaxID=857566 RepID=A0A1E3PEG5_9ASCO|nr:vacuolar protein sorting/targeting protein 10 [Nadsonia fulvescens var. elongata DSM 6958]